MCCALVALGASVILWIMVVTEPVFRALWPEALTALVIAAICFIRAGARKRGAPGSDHGC